MIAQLKSFFKKTTNNSNILISLMMPAYNNEQYIGESIESVMNQTYSNWELIIIDDGSTDNTGAIAKNYVAQDSRILYHQNEKNIGIPKSRNIALRLAKGDYVGHIDSDDILVNDALSVCVQKFQENPEIKMIYSNFEQVDKENKHVLEIWKSKPFIKTEFYKNPVWSHFGIYNRKAALEVGGFNEDLITCSDGELYLKLAEKYALYHIDKINYRRRIHDNNIVKKYLKHGCKGCWFYNNGCPCHKIINKHRLINESMIGR